MIAGDNMITMKDIPTEEHKVLRKKAKELKIPLKNPDKQLAKRMLTFLKNSQDEEISTKYNLMPAVGIAAPQIKVSKRMFAVNFNDFDDFKEFSYVVINPVIKSKSNEIIYLPDGEGCLSVRRDTNNLLTPRNSEITISYHKYDPINDTLEYIENEIIKNYPAIVFQHECDHLDGILYIDKMYEKIDNGISVFEKYPDLKFTTKS